MSKTVATHCQNSGATSATGATVLLGWVSEKHSITTVPSATGTSDPGAKSQFNPA